MHASSLPVVDFLVQNSGASDKRTKSGSTPLHYCAMYGKTEPAKLLLRAGVDLQVQDNDKMTPLDVARVKGHKAVEDLVRLTSQCTLTIVVFCAVHFTVFIF